MKTNLIRNRIRSFVGLNERVFFSLPSSVRPSVPPSSELVFFGLSELPSYRGEHHAALSSLLPAPKFSSLSFFKQPSPARFCESVGDIFPSS